MVVKKPFAQKRRGIFKFFVFPKLISQQGYPWLKFIQLYIIQCFENGVAVINIFQQQKNDVGGRFFRNGKKILITQNDEQIN